MSTSDAQPTARPKQRRLRAPVRREVVLAAALEVFAERGYRASMEEVAKASGVTRTVLYYYFPTKKELFLAVLDTQVTEFLRHIAPAVATPGSFEERIRATVDALLEFAENSPRAWDVVFFQRDEHDDVAEVRSITRRMIKVTAEALLSPADMSTIGVDPSSVEGDLLFDVAMAAVVEGVAWWRRNPAVDRKTVLDGLTQIFGRVVVESEQTKAQSGPAASR